MLWTHVSCAALKRAHEEMWAAACRSVCQGCPCHRPQQCSGAAVCWRATYTVAGDATLYALAGNWPRLLPIAATRPRAQLPEVAVAGGGQTGLDSGGLAQRHTAAEVGVAAVVHRLPIVQAGSIACGGPAVAAGGRAGAPGAELPGKSAAGCRVAGLCRGQGLQVSQKRREFCSVRPGKWLLCRA